MEAAVCGKSVLIRRWFYGARRSFCSPARSFSAARHCAGRFSKRSAPRPATRRRLNGAAGSRKRRPPPPKKSARVCLNTAAKEELLALPGVGEKTAERILAYRDTYGKFVTVEQLLDVEGIGEGLLEQLRPYVYVEESE